MPNDVEDPLSRVSSTPPPALLWIEKEAQAFERRGQEAAAAGDFKTACAHRETAIALMKRVNAALAGELPPSSIDRDELLAQFYAKQGGRAAETRDFETATRWTNLASAFLDSAEA